MASVGDIFYDDFLCDVVDTWKEGIEQHKKQECLKGAIDKGKGDLLGKWAHERVDKASNETINQKYTEYILSVNLMKKVKKLQKRWASMSLNYILKEFLGLLKLETLKNYAKTLRIIQSLKIKWRAWDVF